MSECRDDEIRAATIGEPTRVDGPITLAEYDPGWPSLFAREAGRIRSLLGDRVQSVEHVGSTSVPGLAAKPIIDIVLAVPDSADEAAKRALAARRWTLVQHYADAKGEVVEGIIARAMDAPPR